MSTVAPLRALATALLLGFALTAHSADIRVEIEGLDEQLEANARAHLSLVTYAAVPDLSETNIRALHARAQGELRAALEPYGYYEPAIRTALRREGETWVALYTVAPGEPVRVRNVDFGVEGPGAGEPALRAALDASPVRKDAVLRHNEYERTRDSLLAAALEHGYRDAELTEHRLDVDPAARTADVTLRLRTGQRYRFGDITFEQEVLREEALRRYLIFVPGDPYDAKKVLDLQYALYDSGYYSAVEVVPGEPEGDRVPLLVRMEPRLRHTYRFGVGYGTDTGARVSFGYENRRLNDRGHRGSFDVTLSSPKQEIAAQYVVPLRKPATDYRSIGVRTIDEELGDTTSTKLELVARDTRELGAWQRQLYVRLPKERTDIADVSTTTTLLIPGTLWTRTESDNVILPMRGSYIGADLHGTEEALGSDTSFVSVRFDGRIVRPLGERGRLIGRGTLGAIEVDDFDLLPASERFFAGGEQSVRGFDLNSLGPVDADGNVVGGTRLVTASFEYEVRVRGPWGIAFFVDGGNALDDFGDELEYGAGIGLRYRTPLGNVRIDLAVPVSEAGGLHAHFGFGPEL